MNPSELIVTLKGGAKDSQWTNSFAGIYVLGPNLVNDNQHWLQDSGSKGAIWNLKDTKIWAIGLQDDLGSSRVWIVSKDEVAGPQEARNWQYFDGPNWIQTSDLMIDTFVKPGAYIIYVLVDLYFE